MCEPVDEHIKLSHEWWILTCLAQFKEACKEAFIAQKTIIGCKRRMRMDPLDLFDIEGQACQPLLPKEAPDLVRVIQRIPRQDTDN